MSDLTAEEIFDEVLPEKLEGDDSVQDIGAVYEFSLTDGGTWSIDFTKDGDYVSEGEHDDPDCAIEVSSSDFVDMWNGKKSGQQLFMMGKISVDGDMGLALKLQKFIG
ncbi:MAG: SCP2 sterol-binding domain-containing protein [Bradymonadaceae bacterium]